MKLEKRILLALANLINEGDRHITGYKLAQKIGVERAQIYTLLRKIRNEND